MATTLGFGRRGPRDGEAGMDYFGARFYQPRHRRFSTVDPVYAGLFDPQSWNRYTYVRNSPLALVDPEGSAACQPVVTTRANDPWNLHTTVDFTGCSSGAAQALLNGPDNMANFAAQASADLRGQAPPGNTGQHEKGERKVPLVNETTGEVKWVTEGELIEEALVVTGIAAVMAAPALAMAALSYTALLPNSQGVTSAAVAMSKHPSVVGFNSYAALQQALRTVSERNQAAAAAVDAILRNGALSITYAAKAQQYVIQFRLPSGVGARWTLSGRFVGFIEP
jgi:RHS repeat-associated protein